MIDSSAGGEFIDLNWAHKQGIPVRALRELLPVLNVDGTPNYRGDITHEAVVSITLSDQTQCMHRLLATVLGQEPIILGFTWLR